MDAETETAKVLIQPAAGDAARDHYRETIEEPVPVARLRPYLSEEVLQELTDHHPSGEVYIWGLTPGAGGRGRTQWEKISPGDVALFSWDGQFRSYGRVTVKAENADLARELWGTDDDGQTWQLLYFLTEPAECAIPYEEFNEAAGYKRKFVPRGFTVLDDDRSEDVLDDISDLRLKNHGSADEAEDGGVREAYRLFRQDRLESLRVRVRAYRAGEIRDLLRNRDLDPETFNVEVWQLGSGGQIEGEEFADQYKDGVAPSEDLLERIELALEQDNLELHGNHHWRPGTRVFGAQFGHERRRDSLRRALDILNREGSAPLDKYRDLAEVDGFGPSTASGLVMLLHPEQFAVYNSKSKAGLRRFGRSFDTIEEFQSSVAELREMVGATDYPELDRFLYLVEEDCISIPGSAAGRPNVWWVNQGQAFEQGARGGYVWAPTENKNGTRISYHENVARLVLGDRILHYAEGALRAVGTITGSPVVSQRPSNLPSDTWQDEGFFADVEYDFLDEPIERNRIPEEWRLEEDGPFSRTGGVKQGYLFPLSENFTENLVGRFPQLRDRFPEFENGGPQPVVPEVNLEAVVQEFSRELADAGLRFGAGPRHEAFVRDFVVSLATKQLVILTGLSGSGKTQIALQFGRWLSGDDEDRYRVVPVRPDWSGPEALFGYEDALQEPAADGRRAWHVPAPLEFMLRAARDEEHPYLMILDEMNLAHVERYFADVISGMESGEGCLPNLRREEDGAWRKVPDEDETEKLAFPDNLFIAGTVNVDETTYMFSPKVLDRANTLEFRVETEDLEADIRKPGQCEPGDPSLVRGFLEIAGDDDWHRKSPPEEKEAFVEELKDLHRTLDGGFSFGHRVLYEAVRFASLHEEAGGRDMEEALDVQVMQKILPRLHGSRRRLEPVMRAVGKFCWDLEPTPDESDGADGFDPADDGLDTEHAALPRSFDKVARMTRRLRANQFVSFTE